MTNLEQLEQGLAQWDNLTLEEQVALNNLCVGTYLKLTDPMSRIDLDTISQEKWKERKLVFKTLRQVRKKFSETIFTLAQEQKGQS